MQPLGAVLLVKYPTGKVISIAVMLWAVTLCGMVACRSFGGLLATRILLGSFEALIGEFSGLPSDSRGRILMARIADNLVKLLLSLQLPRCGGAVASRQIVSWHGLQ
jgi:hypothetical protein